MNQAYKFVWDELRGMLVIVAENCRARGKKTGKCGQGRALAVPVFAFALAAGALAVPVGGEAWAGNVCLVDTSNNPSNPTINNLGDASGTGAIACGKSAKAQGWYAIALGDEAYTEDSGNGGAGNQGAIAIGYQSKVATNSDREGTTQKPAQQGIGIGMRAHVEGRQSTALGANTRAFGGTSFAFGGDDVDSATNQFTALGTYLANHNLVKPGVVSRFEAGSSKYYDTTTSIGEVSMALGAKAKSTGHLSNAIGMGADSLGEASMALGTTAFSPGKYSSAIGTAAMAGGERSSAIGLGAATMSADTVALGTGATIGTKEERENIEKKTKAVQEAWNEYHLATRLQQPVANAKSSKVLYDEFRAAQADLESTVTSYNAKYANAGAIGAYANTTVSDGYALGSYSKANREAGEMGADGQVWKNKAGVVSPYGYNVLDDAAHTLASGDKASTWAPTLAAISVGDGKNANLYFQAPNSTATTTNSVDPKGNPREAAYMDDNGNVGRSQTNQLARDTAGNQLYFLEAGNNTLVTKEGVDNDGNARVMAYVGLKAGTYVRSATNGRATTTLSGDINTRRITNLAAGAADTDAVNVAQLKQVRASSWKTGDGKLKEVNSTTPGLPPSKYDVKINNKYYQYVNTPVNIEQGDKFNFVDGDGTTVVISPTTTETITDQDGTTTTRIVNQPSVTYNVNKQGVNPLEGKATLPDYIRKSDGAPVIKKGDKYYLVNSDGSVSTNEVVEGDLDKNYTKKVDNLVTAGDVANTINNTYWTAKDGNDDGTANKKGYQVKAGREVIFKPETDASGNNTGGITVTRDDNTFTFAVKQASDPGITQVVTTTNSQNVVEVTTTGGNVTGGSSNNYWDSSQVQTAINDSHWNVIGGANVMSGSVYNVNPGKNVEFTSDGTVTITQSEYKDGSNNVIGTSFAFGVDPSSINASVNKTEVAPDTAKGTAYSQYCLDAATANNCPGNKMVRYDGSKYYYPNYPNYPNKEFTPDPTTVFYDVNGNKVVRDNTFVTANDVAKTINETFWQVKGNGNEAGGQNQGGNAFDRAIGVKAGDLVTFTAGDGVTLKAENTVQTATDPGKTTYTFAVNQAPDPGADQVVITSGTVTNYGGWVINGQENQYWDSSQVQDAINNSYWTAKDGTGTYTQVNPGSVVTIKPDTTSGLTVTLDEASKTYTIDASALQSQITNSGWKIAKVENNAVTDVPQGQVTNGGQVAFVNGTGTTVAFGTVDNNGVQVPTITYNINQNTGGSVKQTETITDPNNPNTTITNYGGYVTGGEQNQYWDSSKVEQLINDTFWTAQTADEVANGTGHQVNPGGNVVFGSNDGSVTVSRTNGNFDFSVNASSVQGNLDPLKFKGDDNTVISKNLGQTMNIVGGATDLTSKNNIGVVSDNGALRVKLAKNIDLGGDGSVTTGDTTINNDGMTIKGGPQITKNYVSMGGNKIVNVAAGEDPTDAVNVSQLTQHIGGNTKTITIDGDDYTIISDDTGGRFKTYNVQYREGHNPESVKAAIDMMNEEGIKFFHTNDGKRDQAKKPLDKGYAFDASAEGRFSTAIGYFSTAKQDYALSVGPENLADGEYSTVVGSKNTSVGRRNTVVGTGHQVYGTGSGAYGDPSYIGTKSVPADGSYAFGNNNTITAGNAFALGNNTHVTRSYGVAVGANAKVTAEKGVALGANSLADRGPEPNKGGYDVVTGGPSADTSPTWRPTAGAVAVGDPANGVTRRITGVAAGAEGTDAVNVEQLKRVHDALNLSFSGDRNIHVGRRGNHVSITLDPNPHVNSVTVDDGLYVVDGPSMTQRGINAAGMQIQNVAPGVNDMDAVNVSQLRRLENKMNKMGDRADAGIAGAMAAAAVPQVTDPGKNLLGAGAGYFHDQSAVAVGYSAMSDNGKWILRANASVSTEEAAASAGVGYQW